MKNLLSETVKQVLAAGLLVLCTGSALAQDPAAKTSGIGTITEIGHDEEYMYINDDEYLFRINELEVILQDQPTRLNYLQDGMIVRFETDETGYVVRITLLGPKSRLDEIMNQ